MTLRSGDWDESEHPRDEDGKFTDSGGGGDGDGETFTSYPQNMAEGIAALKASAPKFFGDRTFTDSEIESVNEYVGFIDPTFEGTAKPSGFESINSNLRKNSSYTSKTITNLDSAIDKAIVPENMVVYRGIGNTLSKAIGEKWTEDKNSVQFTDKAFVSTSINKGRATKFSKNVMEIRLRKGAKALPISWNGEGELLLPRGQSFRVLSVKKTPAGHRRIVAELVNG